MWRNVLAVLGGLVAWTVIATLINFGLRTALPGYTVAEHTLDFTLTMKIARLTMAAITSLGAGAATRAISPKSRWAPWIVGAIALALFLPSHVMLWPKFPVWYHLTFLLTLVPLVVLGASLGRKPG